MKAVEVMATINEQGQLTLDHPLSSSSSFSKGIALNTTFTLHDKTTQLDPA